MNRGHHVLCECFDSRSVPSIYHAKVLPPSIRMMNDCFILFSLILSAMRSLTATCGILFILMGLLLFQS